ncbi:RHS repeat-associated core domain-containing protein [Cellulomonas sp. URHE0023]|uniref:RHS repeat-associated core domain-containing protein n=1 Tax=Cellulomonas sp. URHE0023 TaxID=1380354 RepID=UPI00350ED968
MAGQTPGITTKNSTGEDLLALAYEYTPAGLLADQTTTRTDQARAPPAAGTTTSQFSWDPLGRIASIAGDNAGAFDFDAAGSVSALADGRTLTYDTARQATTLIDPGTNTTTTFGYDDRGNRATTTATRLAGIAVTSHTYDQANRLTSVTSSTGATTSYTYDAAGLRATATTGGVTEDCTWQSVASIPLLVTDATHAYVYGSASIPLAQITLADDTVTYLHTDLIGSVRTTTNRAGDITSDADYDTYGRSQTTTGTAVSTATPFGYAGEYTDPTGYIYLRARYYDPNSAQFLTRDPLEATTGNPYGYTDGNPLQFTDPLGLTWWKPQTWTAGTWDNISTVLVVASVIVSATGIGAPIGAILLGGSMLAAGGAALKHISDGDCIRAAMSALGMIPGGGLARTGLRAGIEGAEVAAREVSQYAAKEAAEAVAKEAAEGAANDRGSQFKRRRRRAGRDCRSDPEEPHEFLHAECRGGLDCGTEVGW